MKNSSKAFVICFIITVILMALMLIGCEKEECSLNYPVACTIWENSDHHTTTMEFRLDGQLWIKIYHFETGAIIFDKAVSYRQDGLRIDILYDEYVYENQTAELMCNGVLIVSGRDVFYRINQRP